jgi:hypothetical protein
LAGALNEFFAAVYIGGVNNTLSPGGGAPGAVSTLELPLASPDSITVTTEFGVLQETGNLTVITAGGAYSQDYVDADEDGVEMTEDVQEQHHSGSTTTTTMQQPSSSNDMGDEADVETDDASAPAGGGALTPTVPTMAG